MPRSLEDLISNYEETLALIDAYEPKPEDEIDVESYLALREAIGQRYAAEQAVADAVAKARERRVTWAHIGHMLGTSGEAARQRYGKRVSSGHGKAA